MNPPTISMTGFVVTLSGLPPGAVVGWGDSRESVVDAGGVVQHDYDSPEATAGRISPLTTGHGRRLLVINMPDGSDRWVGHVDLVCPQTAW
jgi:hypothetical protein